jgi:hypothetical protein
VKETRVQVYLKRIGIIAFAASFFGLMPLGFAVAQNVAVSKVIYIRVEGPASIPATGHGFARVVAQLHDAYGRPLIAGIAVRAVILHGDARFATGSSSADATTDASGEVSLAFLPGTKAGPLSVRLDTPGGSGEIDLALTAATRKPLVVGFATGGVGPVPGWIEAPDNAPNGTDARRGTISIFGTGEISHGTVGTFAYDTADSLQQTLSSGPFLDNPNDRPFPIYGDSSLRYDDALSTNHLYARVDNGLSSAMWGEFNAQAAPGYAVGGYNVLVNGAKVHAEGNVLSGTAFTAKNNIAYARQTILPTGLAIASEALHPDIVVGSDVLTLVQLDRRSGAVLAQTVLIRGSDYVIDYASGLLRFTNIILPYDDQFNPQVVLVQYEYGGAGAASTMLGGSSEMKFADNGRLDAWYLNDSFGSGNLTLFGQSIGQSKSDTTTWNFSHEHSSGFNPGANAEYGATGDAYEASFAVHTSDLKLALNYNNTSAGYVNPYGNYAAPGLQSLNGLVTVKVSRISEVDLNYLYARNQLPATSASEAVSNYDSEATLTLRVKPNARFSYQLGLQSDVASSNGVISPALLFSGSQTPGTPNDFFSGGFISPLLSPVLYQAGSGQAFDAIYGFAWKFAPHATFSATRQTQIGGTYDPYDPQQTQAELDLDVGNQGKAFIRQLWQQTSVQALAATQTGQTYAGTASSSTSIGFQQQMGQATFESGYAVQHTANGTDLFDAMGVREKIISTPRLSVDGFLQLGQSLYSTYAPATTTTTGTSAPTTGTSPYFLAMGTSVNYTENSFKATGQVQIRTGFDGGSTFQLGATGPISPSVSLFGSATGSYTQDVIDSDYNFGLSYRPALNDRYVTLLSVDTQKSNLTNYDSYVTNIAQIQELYRPSTHTELAGSLAYKLAGDAYFQPGTSIWGLRADQRIGNRFDLASEYHHSDIAPLDGFSATGFAVEAGYRFGSTLRLAGGYNFSGFADPSASVNPTHRGLYFTLSTYIDRVGGWGKANQQ